MKKSFEALVTSINRYVAVFSIILSGFAVLLSAATPASRGGSHLLIYECDPPAMWFSNSVGSFQLRNPLRYGAM